MSLNQQNYQKDFIEPTDSDHQPEKVEKQKTPEIPLSPYIETYLRKIKPSPINFQSIAHRLQAANISITTNPCRGELSILEIKSSIHHEVIELTVQVGKYVLGINIININGNSPVHAYCFSQGSFGALYKYRSHDGSWRAVKCLEITSKKPLEIQLMAALIEVSFLKIASILECGPKVSLKSFDILMYLNKKTSEKEESSYIEFQMQFCESKKMTQQSFNKLLESLSTLHQASIVHSDIKPDNILFSESFQKWVFLDFGVSSCLRQRPGEQTKTTFRGTLKYASSQMNQLYQKEEGLVDLYWNDVSSLYTSKPDIVFLKSERDDQISKELQQIAEYFLLIQLKFNIYFNNITEVIGLSSTLNWTQNIKNTLFNFFQELAHLPSNIKSHFHKITSWEGVSSFGFLDPSKVFSTVSSALDFRNLQNRFLIKPQKQELFERVYDCLVDLKGQHAEQRYLKMILDEKTKYSLVSLLQNLQDVESLPPEKYMKFLFQVVNFCESFSIQGEIIGTDKKESLCKKFEEVDYKNNRQKDNIKFSSKSPSISIFYFIRRTLFECLQNNTETLQEILIPAYINYLMLGQADTATVKSMYQLLPSLNLDLPQICHAFYLVHLNRLWFQKVIKIYNPLELLEVRSAARQSMEAIASKMKGYSEIHKCSEPCQEREQALLKLIYGVEKTMNSFDEFQNQMEKFQKVLSTLKRNYWEKDQQQIDDAQYSHKYNPLKFPLNVAELLSDAMLYLNFETYLSVNRHIKQTICMPQVSSNWVSTAFAQIQHVLRVIDDEDEDEYTDFYQNYIEEKIMFYRDEDIEASQAIIYLINIYQIKRYFCENQSVMEVQQQQLQKIMLHCYCAMRNLGDRLSPDQIVEYLLNLPIKQAAAVWQYLNNSKRRKSRNQDIIQRYETRIKLLHCSSKSHLKQLQFDIFKNLFLNDWKSLSEEQKLQVSVDILKRDENEKANYLRLKFIQFSLNDFKEKGIEAIDNERFYLYFSFFENLLKKSEKTVFYFLTVEVHSSMFDNFLRYLLWNQNFKGAAWLLQKLTSKALQYLSRQMTIRLFKLKQIMYHFFLFENSTQKAREIETFLFHLKSHSVTFLFNYIFLIFMVLYLAHKNRQVFAKRKIGKFLYASLQLHHQITNEAKLQDIQLSFRCFWILHSIKTHRRELDFPSRKKNHFARMHKKIIQRLLPSFLLSKDQKNVLKQYAAFYTIPITWNKNVRFEAQERQFINNFKMKFLQYYSLQQKSTYFDIDENLPQKRYPRKIKNMLPIFD